MAQVVEDGRGYFLSGHNELARFGPQPPKLEVAGSNPAWVTNFEPLNRAREPRPLRGTHPAADAFVDLDTDQPITCLEMARPFLPCFRGLSPLAGQLAKLPRQRSILHAVDALTADVEYVLGLPRP